MSKKINDLGNGYLYSLWNGHLREYRGYVSGYERECRSVLGSFSVIDEHGETVKLLQCSYYEGKIQNKMVWFHDRNKEAAIRVLIDYERNEMAKLEFRIKNHKEIIETLSKELES